MKYFNIKRYKFSTVIKNFNTLGASLLKIFKPINLKKIYKYVDFGRYNFGKIYKYIDLRGYNFTKITKYLSLKTYTYKASHIKKISFIRSKFLILHLPVSIIFFLFLYISIPILYSYDKSKISDELCKNYSLECSIKGHVNYSFFPTPRLKIQELIINLPSEKNALITAKKIFIKLSLKNLLAKEKHKFKQIKISNFEANLDLKKFTKYKNIFNKKIRPDPIFFKKGKIIFFDKKNYIASITNVKINTKFKKGFIQARLKGKFLNEDININFNKEDKNHDNNVFNEIVLKMPSLNFITKSTFSDPEKNKGIIGGNFLIKKNKNKITGLFDYQNSKLTINKSNIRNAFVDGKMEGKIIFLPYFDFNLDLILNSINFTKLYNYFLSLDEMQQKNLFKINNKINGKVNFSSDKIYTKHNLAKSFESRINFYNGNVKIEQLLVSLGKLGAADILGTIHNDKKLSNLKFESNIFVDDQKKFLRKFSIYGKESLPSNLFVSGNFDFENARISFYEISDDEKLNIEDVNFIETEFNDLMLENGFSNLFNFPKFKFFLKSIINEKN